MPLSIPYNQLPDLGVLESTDLVPMLRPFQDEGKAAMSDIVLYVNPGKAYRVSMSQVSTSDPTVGQVYENWIGEIVWTYQSVGVYYGVLAGAFTLPANKTNTFFSTPISGGVGYYTITRIDDDTIELRVRDKSWTVIDGALDNTFIEIIAYYLAP
jgi:hypothetical protein